VGDVTEVNDIWETGPKVIEPLSPGKLTFELRVTVGPVQSFEVTYIPPLTPELDKTVIPFLMLEQSLELTLTVVDPVDHDVVDPPVVNPGYTTTLVLDFGILVIAPMLISIPNWKPIELIVAILLVPSTAVTIPLTV